MKITLKPILLLFLIFSLTQNIFGQSGVNVSAGKRTLNLKDTTVFVLEVNRAQEKYVFNKWKKHIEKNKVKATIINNQLEAKQFVFKGIDANLIDVYSEVVQQQNSVKLYAIFILKENRIDPRSTEGVSVKVKNMLREFGLEIYKNVLSTELKEKQTTLSTLEKERVKNIKEQDKLDKTIQKDSLKIGSYETEIILLKGQLGGATSRYTTQKNKVASGNFSSNEEAKEAKSVLKGYGKERKEYEKEIEATHNEIFELSTGIRNYWYKLEQFKKEETILNNKIVNQRIVVKNAEQELN